MSFLANRMKGVAPSSQVSSLLSANFNVPSRGRKVTTGTAAQLKVTSGTVEGLGFGVSSNYPLLYLRDPADSQQQMLRLATNLSSIDWQKKIGSNNVPSDYTNCLAVDNSGNVTGFSSDGCTSLTFSSGAFRQNKTLPSPFYSMNAIKATTTSNECILNGWGISGSGTAVIQRFNSSTGSVTWGHQISSGEGPPFNQGMGIAESADGAAISYGVRVQGTSQDSWTIRRVNFSNGNQIWQSKYYDTVGGSWQPTSMVESTSNLLVGLRLRHLVALNTSNGNILWQKKMGSGSEEWHDLHWDSGNGYYYGVLRNIGLVICVNTSGTTIFTNEITSSLGVFKARGIRTDSTGMYVFGVISNRAYVIKVPKDGTGIGATASFSDGAELYYNSTTLSETTPAHQAFTTNVSTSTGITTTGTSSPTVNDSTAFSLLASGI